MDDTQYEWRWQPLRELAGGGLLVMEMLLAAFWFTTIARGYKPLGLFQTIIILGVVFGGVYVMERTAQAWPVTEGWRRAIEIAVLVFCLWVTLEGLVYFPALPGPQAIFTKLFRDFASEYTIPLEFWVLVVVLLIWGRSLALAHHPIDNDRISSSLLLGLLSVMAYQFFPQRIETGAIFTGIFLFIFLGLLSMGAARIAVLIEMRGGKQTLASRGWMAGLGASALAAAGLTALLAVIVRGPIGQWVVRLFVIFLGLLGALFSVVLYPVSLLVSYLIIWLQKLLTNTLSNSPLMNVINQMQQIAKKMAQDNGDRLSWITQIIKPATMWAILILILVGVVLAIGLQTWREHKRRMDSATTQLSTADMLRKLGEAARQRARELADELARRLRGLPGARLIQAMRIRWIYGELMELCDSLNRPRQRAVTPLEFLPEMSRLFEGTSADLETITHAYLRVRYGQLPETSQEVHNVVTAWERVKQLGKQLKK
jgi:hypothetical protein